VYHCNITKCTTSYQISEQLKGNDMGGTCSTHRKSEKSMQNCSWGNLRGRDHFEDLYVDGRIILKWIRVIV
jgi:hypothetical protein